MRLLLFLLCALALSACDESNLRTAPAAQVVEVDGCAYVVVIYATGVAIAPAVAQPRTCPDEAPVNPIL
jgi:hypothetical protein